VVLSSLERAISAIHAANALISPELRQPYEQVISILEEGVRATPGGKELLAERARNRSR
jgi:hypothetical protein